MLKLNALKYYFEIWVVVNFLLCLTCYFCGCLQILLSLLNTMEDNWNSGYLVHCINICCTNFSIYLLTMFFEKKNHIPTTTNSAEVINISKYYSNGMKNINKGEGKINSQSSTNVCITYCFTIDSTEYRTDGAWV